MSDHEHGHGGAAVAEAPHAPAAGELRFEKSEIQQFSDEDSLAGRAIGKLLAFLFCVLLVLMTGATIWTVYHQNASHDPHAVPATPSDHAGH